MRNAGAVYLRDPKSMAGRWCAAPVLALAGLAVMLAGAALTAVCVPAIAYPLRLAGQPGLLTVTGCLTEGSGKQARTTCYGLFRPDAGPAAGHPVPYDGLLRVGARVPVQYVESEDTSYRVGVAYAPVRVLGISAGLFALVAGPVGVAQAVEMAAPRHAARWREAICRGRCGGWLCSCSRALRRSRWSPGRSAC
ncbi:hypothetical protein [Kitasatospora cathayae]|uniref:DUF3592 domain-containing protein n=1 Tax=Kitasatospora cathayae TaxID=3004092 RepID=A0ABY7PXJ0_9ACTN|nr:hypothetical protein [Kitasatospora sp. HUAS 3-15]WBP85129.1 hypothetical protein O1G21_04190 [Kitasatospora sp. HUAS 3-15]